MNNEYQVRMALRRLWQTHRILTEDEARRVAEALGLSTADVTA